jgi:predicted acetyltransferase
MDLSSVVINKFTSDSDVELDGLLELYLHDMSEWFTFDINEDGRYGYDLAPHWKRGDVVYVLSVNNVPSGFALIGKPQDWTDHTPAQEVVEFFVARGHRHGGISDHFATWLWNQIPGSWLVRVFEANVPAVTFWRRVISVHTSGAYKEDHCLVNAHYWRHFSFDSSAMGGNV